MATNKPRPSLLSLFDPLSDLSANETPSTPRRDATSEADKENLDGAGNNLTLTIFFNKTYKSSFHPQPSPLQRRLVDIGDMTLEDAASPETTEQSPENEYDFEQVLEDDEENATLTFRDMIKAATPFKTSRIYQNAPSTAIRISHTNVAFQDASPTSHTKPAQEKYSAGSELAVLIEEVTPASQPASAPEMATSTENTDDPEFSFGEIPSNFGITTDDNSAEHHTVIPACTQPFDGNDPVLVDTALSIVVSESSPPSSATPLPDQDSELQMDSFTGATLRPNISLASSHDTSRVSVDLQALFQTHMQSEDTSFDLLSDKMSFFNSQHDMESFLTEDDPSFDLEVEKANMKKALKMCSDEKEQGSRADDADSASTSPTSSGPLTPTDALKAPPASTSLSFDKSDTPCSALKTMRKRLSIPIPSSPRTINHPLPASLEPLPSLSPSNRNPSKSSPKSSSTTIFMPATFRNRRKSSLPLVTPKTTKESSLSLPPIAVPALKIVKRPRPVYHERTDSNQSNPESFVTLKSAPASAVPPKPLELPTIVPLNTKKPFQEEERLEPTNRQRTRPTKSALLPKPLPGNSQTQSAGPGPRRVPISEGPQLKSAVPRSATMPTAGGARRVPNPASVMQTSQPRSVTSAGTAGPNGLKLETGSGGIKAQAASSLPKPISRSSSLTSRLPAPKSLRGFGGLSTLKRAN